LTTPHVHDGAEVTVSIEIRDEDGATLEATDASEPLIYTHGDGELPPGIEKALEGATVGTDLDLLLEVDEAFGAHDPAEVIPIPRNELPDGLEVEVGDWLPLVLEDDEAGEEAEEVEVKVVAVDAEAVTIDLNHPYAGRRLRFAVKVLEIAKSAD